MRTSARSLLVAGLVAAALVSSASGAQTKPDAAALMIITPRAALTTTKGPAANFTGNVLLTPLFRPNEHLRASSASVHFDAGARSAWHSHPAGQTLIITDGVGWAQERGGKKQRIERGDVVWTPPGVEHWHGASATASLTHVTMVEQRDGKAVVWLEHVNDAQYRE